MEAGDRWTSPSSASCKTQLCSVATARERRFGQFSEVRNGSKIEWPMKAFGLLVSEKSSSQTTCESCDLALKKGESDFFKKSVTAM